MYPESTARDNLDLLDLKPEKVEYIITTARRSWKHCPEETRGEEWLECPVCFLRCADLSTHLSKRGHPYEHRSSIQLQCNKLLRRKSELVSGENNPGYQHGGKLSPFSKQFVGGYDDGIWDRRSETKTQNNTDSTRLSFWTERYGEEEGRRLYKDRQTTFSLEKCIEKYGLEEGTRIWEERQVKWQATLNSKAPEEIAEINRSKSFYQGRRSKKESAMLYVIKYRPEGGKDYIKVGVTSRETLHRRFGAQKIIEVYHLFKSNPTEVYQKEYEIKDRLREVVSFTKDSGFIGYTECCEVGALQTVLDIIREVCMTLEEITHEYKPHGNSKPKKVHRNLADR